MKKLFCSILFAVGFFVAAQAQFTVQGGNNTADQWLVKASDGNGNSLQFLTINPGAVFGNTALGISVNNVTWYAENLANGCNTGPIVITAPSSGSVGTGAGCTNTVNYTATAAPGQIVLTLQIF